MSKRFHATSTDCAAVYGSPGERPRLAGLFRAIWPMFVVAVIAGGLLRAVLPFPAMGSATAGGLFLLLAVALGVAVNASRGRLESYLKGARGEECVAHELSFLPVGFTVFHGLGRSRRSIMGGSGDFDHVVVGPTGVFVIETKNWADPVTIEDGNILYAGRAPTRPPIDQVRQAAADLKEKLREASDADVEPRPVVCFAGNALRGDRRTVAGVTVCNVRVLNDLIADTGEQPLSEATQARIAGRLKRMACE